MGGCTERPQPTSNIVPTTAIIQKDSKRLGCLPVAHGARKRAM
jgi:hypothetical protein